VLDIAGGKEKEAHVIKSSYSKKLSIHQAIQKAVQGVYSDLVNERGHFTILIVFNSSS
jgi:hypothetical protein